MFAVCLFGILAVAFFVLGVGMLVVAISDRVVVPFVAGAGAIMCGMIAMDWAGDVYPGGRAVAAVSAGPLEILERRVERLERGALRGEPDGCLIWRAPDSPVGGVTIRREARWMTLNAY